jgi:hypothetical protein
MFDTSGDGDANGPPPGVNAVRPTVVSVLTALINVTLTVLVPPDGTDEGLN